MSTSTLTKQPYEPAFWPTLRAECRSLIPTPRGRPDLDKPLRFMRLRDHEAAKLQIATALAQRMYGATLSQAAMERAAVRLLANEIADAVEDEPRARALLPFIVAAHTHADHLRALEGAAR